jgi:hypothetical protein
MKLTSKSGGGPIPPDCEGVQGLVLSTILVEGREELPPEATAHAEGCPRCRKELEEIVQLDLMMATALYAERDRIAEPASDRMESILAAAALPLPEAALLRRIRRTVNRMLILTLFALSLLPLALLLGWLLTVLSAWKGH